MRGITIGGHPLPERLCQLIAAGRWKAIKDTRLLGEVTGADHPHLLHFLTTPGIRDNLEGLHEIVNDKASYNAEYDYGMASSRQAGHPVALPLLDVDQALPIMVNLAEFMVCLDYRPNPNEPVVVAPDLNSVPGGAVWHIIAPSFDALARQLGL